MAAFLWWPLSIISDPVEVSPSNRDLEFNRLIYTESSGRVNALSKVGAIGLGQITTNCLNHFNWANNKKYKAIDLYNPELNLEVTRWYLGWLEDYFESYPEPQKSVLMYSSYNMGPQRTLYDQSLDLVLVYRPYVKKITPIKYLEFKAKHKLVWRGKRLDLYKIIHN